MNEKENKVSLKAVFKDGVLLSNPLFVSLLGLCPALAITTKFMNAVGMTFAFFFVLLLSNIVISLLRKVIRYLCCIVNGSIYSRNIFKLIDIY